MSEGTFRENSNREIDFKLDGQENREILVVGIPETSENDFGNTGWHNAPGRNPENLMNHLLVFSP